ncbi:MAG: nitroreductase family protein [Microgenomates group bacterium]
MKKNQELFKIKESKTNLPINPIFKKRFSPRFFSKEEVKEEDLKIIFEAVRFTASSYNRQPWFFYLAKKGTKSFAKLASLLMEGNLWAKEAAILILACYINEDEYGKNSYAQYDLGQAVATLVYQAQDLGYFSHQMAGFDKEKAKELVKDKNHIPWVMIALGRLGDYEKASQDLIKRDFKKVERKTDIFLILNDDTI